MNRQIVDVEAFKQKLESDMREGSAFADERLARGDAGPQLLAR